MELETLNHLNEQSKGNNQEPLPGFPMIPKIETDYNQLSDDQLLLTCHDCFKIFTTIKELQWHERVHTGNLYKCSNCDKQYTRRNHLQRHENSHTRRKVHVCKICSKTLVRMDHLKRHLVTHLKEKPFTCKTCNRAFSRTESLHRHMPRCKSDVVYPCDTCNKTFNREDTFEVHKKMHGNQPKLPTIKDLGNIEEHYYQVDQDVDATLSDYSDVDDCFESKVEVTESMDEDRNKKVIDIGSNDDNSMEEVAECLKNGGGHKKDMKVEDTWEINNIAGDGESLKIDEVGYTSVVKVEDTSKMEENNLQHTEGVEKEEVDYTMEVKKEDTSETEDNIVEGEGSVENEIDYVEVKIEDKLEMEDNILEHGGNTAEIRCDAGGYPEDCTDSEYLPKKSLSKIKRGRGRPRKNPLSKAEVHKCNICNKEFSRANILKTHITSHSTLKPFRCDVCSKGFNRKDHLVNHIKLHNKDNGFECDICKRTFSQAGYLSMHKAARHDTEGKIIDEQRYECSLCLKRFKSEKYRDIHVNGHNGHRDYQCNVCERTYLTKARLMEHMKSHGERFKKFLCSECGQRFIRNDYLEIHMRRHRGEKPFKCKYCDKGFTRTTDLTIHEIGHTGEKSHLCMVCGKGFGRYIPFCLQRHLKLLYLTFLRAYNLTVHMRTHTGEKPYQCTYCVAAFAQSNDLKTHIRTHTKERFRCDLCSNSFLVGHLLTKHKRTVHGLNVIGNKQRLQPVQNKNLDKPSPPIVPVSS
ncbi:zinc finger protein 571 [Anoplophora glabripennis]|uniref:zinc finger protein 571 n=1 Tax=Anoplophora glabripennis TaxID=217634 RepID=UPI0008734E5F|nr:zinc finger protein 571 [Anoplophora glabripennis]